MQTKLDRKSSTEAIDDAMAQVLWTRQLCTAQGWYVPITVIYQRQ